MKIPVLLLCTDLDPRTPSTIFLTDRIQFLNYVDRMPVEIFHDNPCNRYIIRMNHALEVLHIIAKCIQSLLSQWNRQYELEE